MSSSHSGEVKGTGRVQTEVFNTLSFPTSQFKGDINPLDRRRVKSPGKSSPQLLEVEQEAAQLTRFRGHFILDKCRQSTGESRDHSLLEASIQCSPDDILLNKKEENEQIPIPRSRYRIRLEYEFDPQTGNLTEPARSSVEVMSTKTVTRPSFILTELKPVLRNLVNQLVNLQQHHSYPREPQSRTRDKIIGNLDHSHKHRSRSMEVKPATIKQPKYPCGSPETVSRCKCGQSNGDFQNAVCPQTIPLRTIPSPLLVDIPLYAAQLSPDFFEVASVSEFQQHYSPAIISSPVRTQYFSGVSFQNNVYQHRCTETGTNLFSFASDPSLSNYDSLPISRILYVSISKFHDGSSLGILEQYPIAACKVPIKWTVDESNWCCTTQHMLHLGSSVYIHYATSHWKTKQRLRTSSLSDPHSSSSRSSLTGQVCRWRNHRKTNNPLPNVFKPQFAPHAVRVNRKVSSRESKGSSTRRFSWTNVSTTNPMRRVRRAKAQSVPWPVGLSTTQSMFTPLNSLVLHRQNGRTLQSARANLCLSAHDQQLAGKTEQQHQYQQQQLDRKPRARFRRKQIVAVPVSDMCSPRMVTEVMRILPTMRAISLVRSPVEFTGNESYLSDDTEARNNSNSSCSKSEKGCVYAGCLTPSSFRSRSSVSPMQRTKSAEESWWRCLSNRHSACYCCRSLCPLRTTSFSGGVLVRSRRARKRRICRRRRPRCCLHELQLQMPERKGKTIYLELGPGQYALYQCSCPSQTTTPDTRIPNTETPHSDNLNINTQNELSQNNSAVPRVPTRPVFTKHVGKAGCENERRHKFKRTRNEQTLSLVKNDLNTIRCDSEPTTVLVDIGPGFYTICYDTPSFNTNVRSQKVFDPIHQNESITSRLRRNRHGPRCKYVAKRKKLKHKRKTEDTPSLYLGASRNEKIVKTEKSRSKTAKHSLNPMSTVNGGSTAGSGLVLTVFRVSPADRNFIKEQTSEGSSLSNFESNYFQRGRVFQKVDDLLLSCDHSISHPFSETVEQPKTVLCADQTVQSGLVEQCSWLQSYHILTILPEGSTSASHALQNTTPKLQKHVQLCGYSLQMSSVFVDSKLNEKDIYLRPLHVPANALYNFGNPELLASAALDYSRSHVLSKKENYQMPTTHDLCIISQHAIQPTKFNFVHPQLYSHDSDEANLIMRSKSTTVCSNYHLTRLPSSSSNLGLWASSINSTSSLTNFRHRTLEMEYSTELDNTMSCPDLIIQEAGLNNFDQCVHSSTERKNLLRSRSYVNETQASNKSYSSLQISSPTHVSLFRNSDYSNTKSPICLEYGRESLTLEPVNCSSFLDGCRVADTLQVPEYELTEYQSYTNKLDSEIEDNTSVSQTVGVKQTTESYADVSHASMVCISEPCIESCQGEVDVEHKEPVADNDLHVIKWVGDCLKQKLCDVSHSTKLASNTVTDASSTKNPHQFDCQLQKLSTHPLVHRKSQSLQTQETSDKHNDLAIGIKRWQSYVREQRLPLYRSRKRRHPPGDHLYEKCAQLEDIRHQRLENRLFAVCAPHSVNETPSSIDLTVVVDTNNSNSVQLEINEASWSTSFEPIQIVPRDTEQDLKSYTSITFTAEAIPQSMDWNQRFIPTPDQYEKFRSICDSNKTTQILHVPTSNTRLSDESGTDVTYLRESLLIDESSCSIKLTESEQVSSDSIYLTAECRANSAPCVLNHFQAHPRNLTTTTNITTVTSILYPSAKYFDCSAKNKEAGDTRKVIKSTVLRLLSSSEDEYFSVASCVQPINKETQSSFYVACTLHNEDETNKQVLDRHRSDQKERLTFWPAEESSGVWVEESNMSVIHSLPSTQLHDVTTTHQLGCSIRPFLITRTKDMWYETIGPANAPDLQRIRLMASTHLTVIRLEWCTGGICDWHDVCFPRRCAQAVSPNRFLPNGDDYIMKPIEFSYSGEHLLNHLDINAHPHHYRLASVRRSLIFIPPTCPIVSTPTSSHGRITHLAHICQSNLMFLFSTQCQTEEDIAYSKAFQIFTNFISHAYSVPNVIPHPRQRVSVFVTHDPLKRFGLLTLPEFQLAESSWVRRRSLDKRSNWKYSQITDSHCLSTIPDRLSNLIRLKNNSWCKQNSEQTIVPQVSPPTGFSLKWLPHDMRTHRRRKHTDQMHSPQPMGISRPRLRNRRNKILKTVQRQLCRKQDRSFGRTDRKSRARECHLDKKKINLNIKHFESLLDDIDQTYANQRTRCLVSVGTSTRNGTGKLLHHRFSEPRIIDQRTR
ncbi:hypothetical protein EG68_10687 [Paragonimus skrjabini miyazakii]|uniref:Uncharacterized protein n=1 Tax=Paragonimus skrjabini miyazakii TaxID=59628 RepID=A0A8S9YNE2_9TREM|nr:hypothetical protein EG68_10687 [Paragonimus skrjabini miyazakii]